MADAEIFDRAARRRAHHGSARAAQEDRWILARMADELLFRLAAVKRDFQSALLLGPYASPLSEILDARGLHGIVASPGPSKTVWPVVRCDEDRLAIADKSVDLILWVGGLDTVNDVPGALILIRRILKPGGLFMGAMAGAGSLAMFKSALAGETAVLRFHPQIDVRASGDLLSRAGFALPVADADLVEARYSGLDRLLADVRANALGNCLAKRQSLTRTEKARMTAQFEEAKAPDSRFNEQFGLIYLTGWAPEA